MVAMTQIAFQICSTITEVGAAADRIDLMPLGEFRLNNRRGALFCSVR